jgi:hypothetical protein
MSQKDQNNNLPSTGEMGKNLADLLLKVAKDSIVGNPILVSEDEQQRRMDICRACDKFMARSIRCKECGCYLNHKTQFVVSECPIEKW